MRHNLKRGLKDAAGRLDAVNRTAGKGDHAATLAAGKEALDHVEPITDAALSLSIMAGHLRGEMRTNVIGMWMWYYRKRLDETVDHLATAYRIHGDLLNLLATSHIALKQTREAIALLEDRIDLAGAVGDRGSASMAMSVIGRLLDEHLDRANEAIERFEQALALARDARRPLAVHAALVGAATAYKRVGRAEDAERCLAEANLLERSLGGG